MPYRSIEDPAKLRRVLEATLLIESNLELPEVLRHVIEEACAMTNARYGALGVLDEDKSSLSEFITVGLSPEQEAAIGPRPKGHGVLGLLISDPKPILIHQIGQHPSSFGFPPNHPPMTSFLGVPITVRDEAYGSLYLTDKVGWSEFTNDDAALVGALSVAAAIAIENARLHDRVRHAAVYDDRDRVARDLHDTVIQRIYAVGLTLQGVAARVPAGAADQIGKAVTELDEVITQVRSTVYDLGMRERSRGVRDDIRMLVEELHGVVGFDVELRFTGPVDTFVTGLVIENLLATIREALTNVEKHARATTAMVELSVDMDTCRLTVADDGVGIGAAATTDHEGLGVSNLRRRAEKFHGTMSLEDGPCGGTILTWMVPIAK